MKKRTIFQIATTIVALVLFITSCTPKPATEVPPTEGVPASTTEEGGDVVSGPRVGGTLTSTLSIQEGEVSSLDPVLTIENPSIFTNLEIYDQFFRAAPDGSVENCAVESFEISEDGLTYTFHFQPKLTFSDGTPVTMDDVVFSIERFRESENWGYLLPAEMEMVIVDDHTVQFNLSSPNAALLSSLATVASSIVPRALVESQGEDFWLNPVTSGPFFVKDWVRGERMILERNAYYWDEPKPYLDQVILEMIPDDNTRMLKFQAGELDIVFAVPYNQIEVIDAMEGAFVQVVNSFATQIVHLNAGVEPLNDLNVRKALQHATDRQAMVDAVLYGYGEVATMLWPKGLLYWDETWEGYPFNLDTAKDYLTQSAYPDGFDITVIYSAGDVLSEQTAALLKDQWSEINVNLEIEPLDANLQLDKTFTGDFDASILYWTSDVIDPSQLNIAYLCEITQDMIGECNEEFDTLAAEADTLVDPTEREAAYAQLFQVAEEWCTNISLYYFPARAGVWDHVKGFNLTPMTFPRFWEVWVEE